MEERLAKNYSKVISSSRRMFILVKRLKPSSEVGWLSASTVAKLG